mgnify:CR=1 FL=1
MTERREMREIDCSITAFRKLNLAILHLCRQIHREIERLFKL